MNYVKLTVAAAAAFALAGCATAKFDAEKTHKVKKLAILSVEIQQQQPKDALGFKKLKEFNERISDSPEFQGMSKDIFNDLANQIQKRTGWSVVSIDKMQSNPEYSAKVKKLMEGARLTSMSAGQNYELIAIKGNLDAFAVKNMKHEEQAKLAHALGADAFAIITIYQQIDQGWSIGNLTGDARFSFQARSNMDVYDLHSDEPIWRIQNVDGDQTAKSDSLDPNLPVRGRLATLGKQAASTSITKLVESYK